VDAQARFSQLSRPTQFAARTLSPFSFEQRQIRSSNRISKPHPNEVKQLVYYDSRQFAAALFEFLIQNYFALANERSSIDRLPMRPPGVKLAAAGAQVGQETHSNRPALECRQPRRQAS